MEPMLLVYFAGLVGQLHTFFDGVGVVSFVFLILVSVVHTARLLTADRYDHIENNTDKAFTASFTVVYNHLSKTIKILGVVVLVTAMLSILIPKDAKTVYMMAGAYVGQQVAMSETGKKVAQIIDLKLDEAIEDTKNAISEASTKKEKK